MQTVHSVNCLNTHYYIVLIDSGPQFLFRQERIGIPTSADNAFNSLHFRNIFQTPYKHTNTHVPDFNMRIDPIPSVHLIRLVVATVFQCLYI